MIEYCIKYQMLNYIEENFFEIESFFFFFLICCNKIKNKPRNDDAPQSDTYTERRVLTKICVTK